MHCLQELVRLHRMKVGARQVAALLGISPTTERMYRKSLAAAGLLEGKVDELPSLEQLAEAVRQQPSEPSKSEATPPQQVSSVAQWRPQVETLIAKGLKPRAIHERLKETEKGYQGSYWAIWRLYKRCLEARGVRAEDVAIPVETAAGEVAQVDFGFVGKLMCPESHVPRRAWVFVMVLGYSRHMYAEVVFDQKTTTWLGLHQRAFKALGGVVETVVPDNLKAAVILSAFGSHGDCGLNRSYRELARHYGFKIAPTPPYQPQKKGKVEAGVKYVKQNVLAGREGEDITEVNKILAHWVENVAGVRKHGTTGKQPLEVFNQEERATLRPLPPQPYQILEWKQAKVHQDSHISFDNRLYSVPWRWVGKVVWVRATATSVLIFGDNARIATHDRTGKGKRITIEEHLPEHRRDLRHRSRSYWEQRAAAIGPQTKALTVTIFESDDVLCQLRKVQAIVTHLHGFPAERAEAAARRALHFGIYDYQGIKSILAQALDFEPLPAAPAPAAPPGHAPRFARSANELLAGKLDPTPCADTEPKSS